MKTILLALLLIVPGLAAEPAPRPIVGLQPLGPVPESVLKAVSEGIRGLYAVDTVILPVQALREAAYFKPRDRYLAVEITDALEAETDKKFSKVIAITAADISAEKDDGTNWGIMGLGQYGGRACVISTFRLGAKSVDVARFTERLQKLANHELGHCFGLDHCKSASCLMQDKRGKIATIDAESGRPCAACEKALPMR